MRSLPAATAQAQNARAPTHIIHSRREVTRPSGTQGRGFESVRARPIQRPFSTVAQASRSPEQHVNTENSLGPLPFVPRPLLKRLHAGLLGGCHSSAHDRRLGDTHALKIQKASGQSTWGLTDLLTRPVGTGETLRETGDGRRGLRLVRETRRNAGDEEDDRRTAHNPATHGVPVACPIGRSAPGIHGHSRTAAYSGSPAKKHVTAARPTSS